MEGLEPTIDSVWRRYISRYATSPYRNTLVSLLLQVDTPVQMRFMTGLSISNNVFLYGGGTAGIRTQNWQIKSLLW